MKKKYLIKVFQIQHRELDRDTYNFLFEKIEDMEKHLNDTAGEYMYHEIIKRIKHPSQSVYYILFKLKRTNR